MVSRVFIIVLLAACVVTPKTFASNADVTIENGVYNNIVVGIDRDTPMVENANDFLNELRTFLTEGSQALNYALNSKATIGEVTLIIPRTWNSASFENVQPSSQDKTIEAADIFLYDDDEDLPNTLQEQLCGVPARQILYPMRFMSLTDEEIKDYGTPGRIFTHEWAHYRYGVHDEHGYPGDDVYVLNDPKNGYPTSCSVGEITGLFKTSCDGGQVCSPMSNDECGYCPEYSDPETIQASLGYLPALSVGQFCNAETHRTSAPNMTNPQNKLCGDRSIMEVIEAHPDYAHMEEIAPLGPKITIMEEPIGRVLFLLDVPPRAGATIDYQTLLETLREPLERYARLEVGVMTYTADSSSTTVTVCRDFAPITDIDDIQPCLPGIQSREGVPSLNDVFEQVLANVQVHPAGTFIITPIYNELAKVGDLMEDTGKSVFAKLLKPFFIFPEEEPALAIMGRFLQYSGSRFTNSNGTEAYNYLLAEQELGFFVDNTYQWDHTLVRIDQTTIGSSFPFQGSVLYQADVPKYLIAYITCDGDCNVNDLTVSHSPLGFPQNCLDEDVCWYDGNNILYMMEFSRPMSFPGEEWKLTVETNSGDPVDITVTWSTANFVGVKQALTVNSWISDGRGPIADIPENREIIVYAEVRDQGSQVLSSRITVKVQVDVTMEDQATESLTLELFDNGLPTDGQVSGDIRRDDSVYSAALDPKYNQFGTVVEIKSIIVEDYGGLRSSKSKFHNTLMNKLSKVSRSGSGLYAMDTFEGDSCCGSFVRDPDIVQSHSIEGFRTMIFENVNFPSITVSRYFGTINNKHNPA